MFTQIMQHFCILSVIFVMINVTIEADEQFCPALDLVCKSKLIEKNIEKVIQRWLDKIRFSPLCFIGDKSETVYHEADKTFEVIRLRNGVRDGVGITFLDEAKTFVAQVTLYQV